jgi:hypothetical protein
MASSVQVVKPTPWPRTAAEGREGALNAPPNPCAASNIPVKRYLLVSGLDLPLVLQVGYGLLGRLVERLVRAYLTHDCTVRPAR